MIKEFYQEVKDYENKTLKVIGIQKFLEFGANINIILTARETTGKTTSALQFIREQFLNYGWKSIFVLNTEDTFKTARPKLLTANQAIYPKKWEGVLLYSNGLYDTKKKQYFCLFTTISTYHKYKVGGRDPLIKYMFYDEFNEGLRSVKGSQSQALENLVRSASKNITLFLFGNRVSMDIPFFADLDIGHIEGEIKVKLYERVLGNKRKLSRFSTLTYTPEIGKENTINDYKGPRPYKQDSKIDWRDMFSYQLGLYGQSVENTKDEDQTEQVLYPHEQVRFTTPSLRPAYFFFYKLKARVLIDNETETFLLQTLKPMEIIEPNKIILTFDMFELKPDPLVIRANRDIGNTWLRLFQNKRVFFSDMVVKNKFFDGVIRYS